MSDEALMEAKIEGSDGTAPRRTPLFNQMAQQLDSAMKGVKLPDAPEPPAKPPEPPKPPPEPVKLPEKPKEEPAKPQEMPPAPTPPSDDDVGENPWNRDWKAIKKHLKERKELQVEMAKAKAKEEALVKELESLKTRPAPTPEPSKTPQELEEIRKALETEKESKAKLEQELKILALERAPEFRDHYQKRFDAAIAQAQNAVPDDAKAKVADLVKLPPTPYRKQLLTELMVDLNEYDRSLLAVAVTEMDRARLEREQALKDNETNYKRLEDIKAQKAAEEQKGEMARRELAIKGVLEAARQRFDAFKPVDGNEKHNEFVKRSEERVMRFFKGELSPEEITLMPVIAAEYEVVKAHRDSLAAELEQARKTISQYESASPAITSGSKKGDTKPKGFIQKFTEAWPGPNP